MALKVEVENEPATTGTRPLYVGYATSGSATNVAAWRIVKITYDASDSPTQVLYANGNDAFENIWDNRGTYSYS